MSAAALARYRLASHHLGREARVLDAWCGSGDGSGLLRSHAPGRFVTGLALPRAETDHDVDPSELAAVPDASFDAVVSFDTLEHLRDPVPFLRHVRRLLVHDGLFMVSAPCRRLGSHDTDGSYDAPALIHLCARFLSVEALWAQAADNVADDAAPVRGWRRCSTAGDHPADLAESLVLVARRDRPVDRSTKSWLFLAPGAPQLATMAAALAHWNIQPREVHVRGWTTVWDDDFHAVMRDTCRVLGFEYGGNLGLAPAVDVIGDPLDYCPDGPIEPQRDGHRIRNAYPVLEGLEDLNVAMPVRPGAPGDHALLTALRPRQVRLVADGIQNDVVSRNLAGMRGFEDGPLASIPTSHEIVCPPWLATEVEPIGRATVLEARACGEALARIGTIPAAQALAHEIVRCDVPFTAIVLSQHFSRSGLTSPETERVFYLHQVRRLLRQSSGRVLFKAHPRDPHRKLAALGEALGRDVDRVRFTIGSECHLPIEAFRGLSERTAGLDVWGTSSSALLGVETWPGTRPQCVDADYLEPEIRRQALQFSRRHHLPLVTVRFDDPLLEEHDRRLLRRRFQRPPAEARTAELTRRLQEAEQQRQAEAARFHREQRLLEALLGRKERTWIWGGGTSGQHLLRRLRGLGVEPLGFLDSAPAPAIADVQGVRVWSSHSARAARDSGALVIIASIYSDDILRRIAADGDWRSLVLTWTDAS